MSSTGTYVPAILFSQSHTHTHTHKCCPDASKWEEKKKKKGMSFSAVELRAGRAVRMVMDYVISAIPFLVPIAWRRNSSSPLVPIPPPKGSAEAAADRPGVPPPPSHPQGCASRATGW